MLCFAPLCWLLVFIFLMMQSERKKRLKSSRKTSREKKLLTEKASVQVVFYNMYFLYRGCFEKKTPRISKKVTFYNVVVSPGCIFFKTPEKHPGFPNLQTPSFSLHNVGKKNTYKAPYRQKILTNSQQTPNKQCRTRKSSSNGLSTEYSVGL